mgnify:CR=1 FL=1
MYRKKSLVIAKLAARDIQATNLIRPEEKARKKYFGGFVSIRIPDEDVDKVRQLIQELGITRTVISFYYFATWMVLLEIWKLSEKPPY